LEILCAALQHALTVPENRLNVDSPVPYVAPYVLDKRKGNYMSQYDDNEPTRWEKANSEALDRALRKRGIVGVPYDEIPEELLKEAEAEALEEVGPRPEDDY
tara:strand:- start:31 stop:336 length:306 start_codon:yes stop_codon:yes gene_type:complete